MRAVLLSLLVASTLIGSAAAQPVVSPRLGTALPEAAVPAGGRAVAGTAFGTAGAIVGGGGAALGVLLTACGPFGCTGPDLTVPLIVAFSAGGAVGSAVLIEAVARDLGWGGYRRPADLGLRRGDGWRALAGAAVGTVPGLVAVALIGPTESGGEWLAVPIAQGIGTGIALSL
jgi:hypothetical protein